jgi:hypothetical protein
MTGTLATTKGDCAVTTAVYRRGMLAKRSDQAIDISVRAIIDKRSQKQRTGAKSVLRKYVAMLGSCMTCGFLLSYLKVS